MLKASLSASSKDLAFVNGIIVHEHSAFILGISMRFFRKSIAIDPWVGPNRLFLGPQVTWSSQHCSLFSWRCWSHPLNDRANLLPRPKNLYTVWSNKQARESTYSTLLILRDAVIALLIWTRLLYSGTCLLFLGLLFGCYYKPLKAKMHQEHN